MVVSVVVKISANIGDYDPQGVPSPVCHLVDLQISQLVSFVSSGRLELRWYPAEVVELFGPVQRETQCVYVVMPFINLGFLKCSEDE